MLRLWLLGAISFAAAKPLHDKTPGLIVFTLLYAIGYVSCRRALARDAGRPAASYRLPSELHIRLCRDALAASNRDAGTQPASLPDARRYRLTLEIDGQRHEVTAADPVGLPAVAELIEFLSTHGSR